MEQLTWRILFSLYKWCPRNPDGESSIEQHQRMFLYHHWYQGNAYCTAIEALPPDVLERMKQGL